nr:M20/M25/M40 family metallo-hydrolase [Ardenticatena sp.]
MQPNWKAVRDEVTRYLQDLLRIDTTNPPGNELAAAEYLAGLLRAEGFDPIVLESAPRRGNLVVRLKGSGEEAPLLLMSHTDVVPAEPDKWEHPPFGGVLADGYIWGRGAVDMKDTVAVFLMLMLLFKRRQDAGAPPLKRDLIFMATADEERGGHLGAGWLVEHHPDLIRAEYAINEGGGHEMRFGDRRYFAVQTAEKGLARFRLTARGEPGHASIPHDQNAVVRLAETVARIGCSPLPTHITATVRTLFLQLAEDMGGDVGEQLRRAVEPEQTEACIRALPLPPVYRHLLMAMTRNTATPTVLQAGSKINVIPSEAVARVDGRVLPGFDHETFYAELEPLLCEGVELEFEDWGPPLESPVESPLFDTIRAVLGDHEPDAGVLPWLLTGATDAKHVVQLGTKVYGFTPMRDEGDGGLMLAHQHNERISVDNLLFSTQILYDVIDRFAGRG